MANQSFGTEVFSTNYDPTGDRLGKPVHSGRQGVGAGAHASVALNVGYYRNQWGNLSIVDNKSTLISDYTPCSI
jgi:hypothetical protein